MLRGGHRASPGEGFRSPEYPGAVNSHCRRSQTSGQRGTPEVTTLPLFYRRGGTILERGQQTQDAQACSAKGIYCQEEGAPEGVRGAGEVDLEVLGSSAAAERGLAEL